MLPATLPLLLVFAAGPGSKLDLKPGYTATSSFPSDHATQAAAVDDGFVYAVSSTAVAVHDRATGNLVGTSYGKPVPRKVRRESMAGSGVELVVGTEMLYRYHSIQLRAGPRAVRARVFSGSRAGSFVKCSTAWSNATAGRPGRGPPGRDFSVAGRGRPGYARIYARRHPVARRGRGRAAAGGRRNPPAHLR